MATEGEPRDDDTSASNDAEESLLPSGPTRSTYKAPKPSADTGTHEPPPPTEPVAVLYQLDDVPPAGAFGLPVEALDMPLPGERILHADGSDPVSAARGMPSPDSFAVPIDLPPPPAPVESEATSGRAATAEEPVAPVFERAAPAFDETAPIFPVPAPVAPPAENEHAVREDDVPSSEQQESEPTEPELPKFTDEPLRRRRVVPEPAHRLDLQPEEPFASIVEPNTPSVPADVSPVISDVESAPQPPIDNDRFADIDFSALPDLPPQSEPAQFVPEQPLFVQPDSSPEESLDAAPLQAESLHAEPSYAEAVQAEVLQEEALQPGPLRAEPVVSVPVFSDAAGDDPSAMPNSTADFEGEAASALPSAQRALTPDEQVAELAKLSAPTSRPWVPERKSLRDSELGALLFEANDETGGTIDVMQELERQVKLREEEAREFQEWHDSMLEVGTPEALAAVQRVAPEFGDLMKTGTRDDPSVATDPADTAQTRTPPSVAPRPDLLPPAPPPAMPAAPPTIPAAPPAMPAAPDGALLAGAVAAPPPPPTAAPVRDAPPPPTAAPVRDAPPPPTAAPVRDAPPPFATAPAYAPSEPVVPIVDLPPEPWAIPDGNVIPEEFERELPQQSAHLQQTAQPQQLVEPEPFGANPFVDAVHTGSIPVVTGSIPIPMNGLDVDDLTSDDAVDDTDQVSLSGIAHPATAPVAPIVTPRVGENETVLEEAQPESKPVGVPEPATIAPTPKDARVGRAARMFWMWFAANSSLVSLAFGAMVFAIGMSLRQAMVGVVIGIAMSLLPLGLSSLAGKRSGQPTMLISRATFGRSGNVLPAIVAVVSRAFWGAALLWLLGQAVSAVLVGALLTGGLSPELISYISMGVGFIIAVAVAGLGYGVIVRLNLVVSVLSGILIAGVVALTWQYVDFSAVIAAPDVDWLGAVATVAVLVFSFLGLLWANSGADLARYQRSGASGAGSGALAAIGAALPAAVLMIYGTVLAASNTQLASGLVENPFDTIGRILPVWYPAPLIAAIALSLVCGAILTVYSGAFAFQAISTGSSRSIAIVISAILIAGVSALLVFSALDMTVLFRDFATTIAVPVAAWAGIFAADTMIRTRSYDSDALIRPGGVYPAVRAGNLVLFIALTAAGFGLTSSTVSWLSWQGYLISVVGLPVDSLLATSDVGVIVALVGGVLFGILTGASGIRRQEAVSHRPQPE